MHVLVLQSGLKTTLKHIYVGAALKSMIIQHNSCDKIDIEASRDHTGDMTGVCDKISQKTQCNEK